MHNGGYGFWATSEQLTPPGTAPLEESIDVDVAIVGGGMSGLWTALEVKRLRPGASVAVFEARHLGHGASGRNGGWLSAKPVGKRDVLARDHGRDAVIATERLLRETMHEIVSLFGEQRIDIEADHGGWLQVARSPSERARLMKVLRASREWGLDESRVRWLDAAAAREEVAMDRLAGALQSPDCYRVNPLKLVHGLGELVLRSGAAVYTDTPVTRMSARSLVAGGRRVTAGRVVIATEGYTARQRGRQRHVLPLNSSMIATRRLTDSEWERIGWQSRAGISGAAHTYFYSQRTRDGRILIGGRGKPYRFGSRIDRDGSVDRATVRALEGIANDLFGWLDVEAEYGWCGVLGVLRDWSPLIDVHADGVIELGGYAGQGLTAAKLAADAVAAIIADADTPARRIPWIRARPRSWEPEPLRWIGANGLYRAYGVADLHERVMPGERTSFIARTADVFAGR